MSGTAWQKAFATSNLAADTFIALSVAYAGVHAVEHTVHIVLIVQLAAACVLAWSFTRDTGLSMTARRIAMTIVTVALIGLSVVEVRPGAAALVGLGWLVCLVRRVRELGGVRDDEVQAPRLVLDLVFLTAAWLPTFVASRTPGSLGQTSGWLLVFSLAAVLSRLTGMHAAQMQSAGPVTPQARRTIETLLLLCAVIMAVLVLVFVFPRFRLALLVSLGVALLAVVLFRTWRSLVGGMLGVLAAFAFAYVLHWLLSGHKVVHHTPASKPSGSIKLHGEPVHTTWLGHVHWGLVGIVIALSVLVFFILRGHARSTRQSEQPMDIHVERSRLPGRTNTGHTQAPTPLRRLVARWLLRQERQANAIVRGETLRAYGLSRLLHSLKAPESTMATASASHMLAEQTLRNLVDAYEAERYGARLTPDYTVEQLQADLRAQGLWHRH